MKKLFWSFTFGVITLTWLLFAGVSSAQQEQGAWVLQEVKSDFARGRNDDAYSYSSSSNRAGEGTASVTCNWPDNFKRKETLTVAGYWTEPPKRILSGQKVSLDMTFKVLANNLSSCGTELHFLCQLEPKGQAAGSGGRIFEDPQKRKNPKWAWFTADTQGPPAGAALSMVGEALPTAGSDMQLRCTLSGGSSSFDRISYVYVYGWDPSGGGESSTAIGTEGTEGTGDTGGASDCGQANVAAMTLLAGKREVKSGEVVTLPVCLLKGAGVADMNFNIIYNSAVAQATNAAKGNLIPGNTLFEANPGEKGTVRMGFAGNKDFSGTGPIAQLTFKAVGKPGDRTPLRVVVPTIGSASGGKPAIATIDGEIKVISEAPATPPAIPPSTPPPTPPTTPTETKGDCDGNARVNAADALCALKMSVGLIPVNTKTDMDNDGSVTSTDARLILQKVVGK